MIPKTDKKFWDSYFETHNKKPQIIEDSLFSDIFKKYLAPDPTKTVLEIGCADSNFLCYLGKKFNFKAYGIDYSDAIAQTADLFKFNGLEEPILYKEDFFEWQTNKKFDTVCSFGFIEHFDDIKPAISKHAELVAPGGKLIITIPHFAHGQFIFHKLIDGENLSKHNIKIMNLKSIGNVVNQIGLNIEHLGYYKTFGFWTERDIKSFSPTDKAIFWSIRKFGKILQVVFGYDRPNRWFSPHIVLVAQKS